MADELTVVDSQPLTTPAASPGLTVTDSQPLTQPSKMAQIEALLRLGGRGAAQIVGGADQAVGKMRNTASSIPMGFDPVPNAGGNVQLSPYTANGLERAGNIGAMGGGLIDIVNAIRNGSMYPPSWMQNAITGLARGASGMLRNTSVTKPWSAPFNFWDAMKEALERPSTVGPESQPADFRFQVKPNIARQLNRVASGGDYSMTGTSQSRPPSRTAPVQSAVQDILGGDNQPSQPLPTKPLGATDVNQAAVQNVMKQANAMNLAGTSLTDIKAAIQAGRDAGGYNQATFDAIMAKLPKSWSKHGR